MEVGEAVRRMGPADDYRHRHWGRPVKVTDGTVQKAEPAWLEALLRALLEVTEPTYPMRYGFEVALRRLASAPGGEGRTAAVCGLAVEGKTWGDVRYALPEVPGWFACAQPAEHLLAAVVDADPADELAACLLQETALRGPGMHGAYGRVASWGSLAALAGVEKNDLAAMERAADRCEWLSYTSDWYLHVAPSMDVGIAGLRPDRRTVVILAITDSD